MIDDDAPDHGGPFDPDWTVAPAGTLAEVFEERGWTFAEAAKQCGIAEATLAGVLRREPLTDEIAAKIAAATDTSERFWLNYERQYRSDLERGRKDTSPPVKLAGLAHGGIFITTSPITVGEPLAPGLLAAREARAAVLVAQHRRGEHATGRMRRECPLCH